MWPSAPLLCRWTSAKNPFLFIGQLRTGAPSVVRLAGWDGRSADFQSPTTSVTIATQNSSHFSSHLTANLGNSQTEFDSWRRSFCVWWLSRLDFKSRHAGVVVEGMSWIPSCAIFCAIPWRSCGWMWTLRIVFVFRQVCNCTPKQLLDNRVCVCVLLKGCRSVGQWQHGKKAVFPGNQKVCRLDTVRDQVVVRRQSDIIITSPCLGTRIIKWSELVVDQGQGRLCQIYGREYFFVNPEPEGEYSPNWITTRKWCIGDHTTMEWAIVAVNEECF